MLLLLILSFLVELHSSECQVSGRNNTYFVSTEDCVFTSSELSCVTVDEFLNYTIENKIMLLFLAGVHNYLTRNVTIKDKFDVTIGSLTMLANQTRIVLDQNDIVIRNLTKFTLSHLSITSFSDHAVLLDTVLEVTIENVIITGSAVIIQCLNCNTVKISSVVLRGSVLVIAWPEYYLITDYFAYKSVVIKNSAFNLAPVGNGISCCNVESLLIQDISISDLPQTSLITPPESRLVSFCAHYPWGLAEREVCDLITTGTRMMEILNSTFKRTSGTGLCIKVPLYAKVIVNKTIISGHTKEGAMFTYGGNGVEVILENTIICNNSNTFSGSIMASALSVYASNFEKTLIPKLTIIRTNFIGNAHFVSRPTTTVSITSHVRATIQDSNFIDIYGNAIMAYTTREDHILITFYGKIVFRNNTSHKGGAIHLFRSRIGLTKGDDILLEHNYAKDVGGAIYVHSTNWLSNYYDSEYGNYGDCFFVLVDCDLPDFVLQFANNSAQNGGEHIFGASLLSDCNICLHSKQLSTLVVHVDFIFRFLGPKMLSFSPVSSYPSRMCIC